LDRVVQTTNGEKSMSKSVSKITPCLWFDGTAEEAANFYASILPDSHVDAVHRAPSDYPSGKAGDVLMVEFTLMDNHSVSIAGRSSSLMRRFRSRSRSKRKPRSIA
jgi:predicted 3-demethylubiquinone-9 3-methyltransferase (glyoxalase superfamily)